MAELETRSKSEDVLEYLRRVPSAFFAPIFGGKPVIEGLGSGNVLYLVLGLGLVRISKQKFDALRKAKGNQDLRDFDILTDIKNIEIDPATGEVKKDGEIIGSIGRQVLLSKFNYGRR